MPGRTSSDTTETTDPTTFVEQVNATAAQVTELLEALSVMLCDREAVINIATDAVLAEETYAQVTALVARLSQVRELSQTIDRLADPMLMSEVS
jgi:uncharacterized protein YabE (DUF348 family)